MGGWGLLADMHATDSSASVIQSLSHIHTICPVPLCRPRAEDPPKASLTQSFDAGDAESGPESGAAPDPLRHIKRPRGAFVFYCLEHGPAVRAATPGISMGDASKRLGEGWKALGAEERAKVRETLHVGHRY